MTLKLHDNCIDFDLQVELFELLSQGIWQYGKTAWAYRQDGTKQNRTENSLEGNNFNEGTNYWNCGFKKDKGLMPRLWDQIEQRIIGPDVVTVKRVYGNAATYGMEGVPHHDDGHWTFMYMPCAWQHNWGGGTGFFDRDGTQVGVAPYKEGRVISFPARLPHASLPVSRLCNAIRYIIVFKTTINSYKTGDMPVTELKMLADEKEISSNGV